MHFTLSSILLILPSIFSTFTSAQGLTQNQTCANACTAAQACDHQCAPGTGLDPYANTNIYIACLCQKGCLCNAEICLQCCDAAGGAGNYDPVLGLAFSCGLSQLGAENVIDLCGVDGTTPAQATPAKACFVYGEDQSGNPTSTYASASPFPSSVEAFISGLLPLTNVTIAASSLITGTAGAASLSIPKTGVTGNTTESSQATANTDTTTVSSQTLTGKTTTTSTSPPGTSTSASSTGQPSASSQKSAGERIWPTFTKGSILLFALPFVVLVL